MASDVRFTTATLNGFLDTINTRLGAGARLRFYTGTKPANADAALSGNTQLSNNALSATPFAAAGTHAIVANAITTDTSAAATGTATWASFVTSGGTRVLDVTAGETADSTDITLDNKSIQIGADVAVTSFTLTLNL